MVRDPVPPRPNGVAVTRSTFLSSKFSGANIEVWGRGSGVKYAVKWRYLVTQHVDRPHGLPSECLRPPVHTRYVSMRWPQDCVRRRTGATRKSAGATLRIATAPREMTTSQTKSMKSNEILLEIHTKTNEILKSMTAF